MYNSYFKLLLISLVLSITCGCKKQLSKLMITGRVIDIQTKLPIAGYPVRLDFTSSSQGMGLNLGSYSNIASSNTDKNGEFVLSINRSYARDTQDYYEVTSFGNDTYVGFEYQYNAQKAEAEKFLQITNQEVYSKILVNFSLNYTGVPKSENILLFYTYNPITNYFETSNGSIASKNFQHYLAPNAPTYLMWKGIKDSIHFGPFYDTIIFTNSNNTYSVSY